MPSGSESPSIGRSDPRSLGVVLLVTAVCLSPSIYLGFIADDFNLIELARRSAPLGLFTEHVAGYYRPVTQLSFWANHVIWGVDPLAYHATNLLIHLINTLLVCLIARRLLSSATSVFVCGIYFGVTPTHASSILWICGRTDLLCATFYLASVWLFVRSDESSGRAQVVLSSVSVFLALLCKEMALSIPVIIFLIALARTSGSYFNRAGRAAFRCLPHVSAVAAYLLIRLWVFGSLPTSEVHESATWGRMLGNVPRYLVGGIVPFDLEAIKPFLRENPSALVTASIVVGLVGLFIAIRLVRDRPSLLLLVCVSVSVLPVLRLYAPWYLYIPSVGIALLVGRILERYVLMTFRKPYVLGIGILALVHLFGLAEAQLFAYRSGQMAKGVIDELRDRLPEGGRAVVLMVPSEYRGVPVFGWIGNVEYAVRLMSLPLDVKGVVGIRLGSDCEETTFGTDDVGRVRLEILNETDFFRLQDMGILTGAVRPLPGQEFMTRHAWVKVLATNQSGHPSKLIVTPKTFTLSDPNLSVYVVSNGELVHLNNQE